MPKSWKLMLVACLLFGQTAQAENTLDIRSWVGRAGVKLVVVEFYATWCKPCIKMMPKLQKLYEAYADTGLVVLGVSIDDDKARIKKIKRFVKKVDVSYPIFSDAKEEPAWHMFNVKVLPAAFLIDPNGQIVAQWTGKIDHKQVEEEVAVRMAPQKKKKNL